MNMDELEKVIIVEGRSDLMKVKKIVNDDLMILCTNGTLGISKLEDMIDEYMLDEREVIILVDEDASGKKLRKQLNKELPHARNLYVDRSYREVETTPDYVLASILVSANIEIFPEFLKGRTE